MDTRQRHSGPRRLLALLALAATALAGCSRDAELPGAGTAEREPASLVVTAELPRLSVAVRGTRADGEGGTGFDDIDKEEISRLTFFLIDWTGNRLVGYRNIYPNPDKPDYIDERDEKNGFVDDATGQVNPTLNSGTKVRLAFDHDNPKHGATERLSRGNYTILAIANFREATHAGYQTEEKIDDVIRLFERNRDKGIENFSTNETCKAMYNMLLKMPCEDPRDPETTQPYLRPSDVPMPVSTALDLPLIAGMNRASLQLTRVCARVQIEVRNYSSETLTIDTLGLSKNFTQSACFLIPRQKTERNYNEWKDIDPWKGWGAPDVTHERAITPFKKGMTIEGNKSDTIFDGLIYESCDKTDNYVYTIGVEYKGADYSYFNLKSGSPIRDENDVKDGHYLIRQQAYADFVHVTTNGSLHVTNTNNYSAGQLVADGMKNYFWKLIPQGGGYKFQNVATEDYIQFPSRTGNTVLTTQRENDATTITVSQNGNNNSRGLTFQGNNYYASADQTATSLTTTNRNNAISTRFWLYELEEHQGAALTLPVTLTTIDPVTGEVFPVHEIRRNDFIHILVEVSYNPKTGDIDFEVSSWNKVGNEIEYN